MLDFAEHPAEWTLTDEQLVEVELAKQEARAGKFATEERMTALWKRFGL